MSTAPLLSPPALLLSSPSGAFVGVPSGRLPPSPPTQTSLSLVAQALDSHRSIRYRSDPVCRVREIAFLVLRFVQGRAGPHHPKASPRRAVFLELRVLLPRRRTVRVHDALPARRPASAYVSSSIASRLFLLRSFSSPFPSFPSIPSTYKGAAMNSDSAPRKRWARARLLPTVHCMPRPFCACRVRLARVVHE
ncbi:hypothetical protein HYPSUDRAFT_36290 [Hypholoma sublateritium FD-334 SS-4]|uniref:Uncharacterized protein n=1 Tax=Hypholoma sublateritium (strain FD-334 SS-4) TaxID=945553 RepID=A0A0D2Q4R8_HYPSF|nr:hypothetical protein HYPSUDRAFT_36290 [Hypholoma sublateritium FD-334 SS-4]